MIELLAAAAISSYIHHSLLRDTHFFHRPISRTNNTQLFGEKKFILQGEGED